MESNTLNATVPSVRPYLAVLLVVCFSPAAAADVRADDIRPPQKLSLDQQAGSGVETNSVIASQDAVQTQPQDAQPDVAQPQEDPDDILELDISDLGSVDAFAPKLSASDVSGAGRQITADSPAANIISGVEAGTRNTTDAGTLLGLSSMNPGVYVQRRSPIIGDPRIRGYRFGQYLARADGAFWYPARLDLDSIISKIDSKIIDDVIIINGPYSSRYGPGFSFIDIVTRSTPRYECGCTHAEGSTGLTYNSNGEQWNANQYVKFGAEDWGGLGLLQSPDRIGLRRRRRQKCSLEL